MTHGIHAVGEFVPEKGLSRTFLVNEEDPRYSLARQIRFKLCVTNETSRLVSSGELMAYLPTKQTNHQLCQRITTSMPARLRTDQLGNQVLYVPLDHVAPFGTVIITIEVDYSVCQQTDAGIIEAGETDYSPFLLTDRYSQSDVSELFAIAEKLTRENVYQSGRAIYDWVIANVEDVGYTAEDKPLHVTLTRKTGDCSEMAHLFCALARVQHIPAQYLSGYYVEQSRLLHPATFHNWAQFYDGHVWRLADPQGRRFDRLAHNYLIFAIAGGQSATWMHGSYRFRVAGEGLAVRMPRQHKQSPLSYIR